MPAKYMMRVGANQDEPGAYQWAGIETHMKAGVASLLPFAMLYFGVLGFFAAMQAIATGGFIIAPVLTLIYTVGWAYFSRAVLYILRHEHALWKHLAGYSIAGIVAMPVVVILIQTAVIISERNGGYFWESPHNGTLMLLGMGLGALGAPFGRYILGRDLTWVVDKERPPLPDVFKFEKFKRDRDSYEQL